MHKLTEQVKMRASFLGLVAVLVAAACGDDGGSGDAADAAAADASAPDAVMCTAATPFFVNGLGESFSSGTDDPATNTSSLISATYTMTAPTVTQQEWQDILTCVRGFVAAYNVDVVDSDPSPAAHHEIVVTSQKAEDVGLDAAAGSIGKFDCDSFVQLGFVFEPQPGPRQLEIMCEHITSIILRTASVDNLYDCRTLPSELPKCGDRSIIDEAVECGEFQARTCNCGGTTQNPHQAMIDRFGVPCSN